MPDASNTSGPHVVMYPGSFDPMTYGHLDVIARARRLFDRIIVGVGQNPSKAHLFTVDERLHMARTLINEIVRDEPDHAPVDVRPFAGLTVDFARSVGAAAIIRGIRNLSDLQNEVQQAMTNREVAGLETAFVVAGPTFAYTSSSLIKQITAMGDDIDSLKSMCPPLVLDMLRAKKAENAPLLERLKGSDGHDDAD